MGVFSAFTNCDTLSRTGLIPFPEVHRRRLHACGTKSEQIEQSQQRNVVSRKNRKLVCVLTSCSAETRESRENSSVKVVTAVGLKHRSHQ